MVHRQVEGKTPEELFALVQPALEDLGQVNAYRGQSMQEESGAVTEGFHLLARARRPRRPRRPGLVFPRAVDIGEQEPLRDVDSRLFVGLGAE